MQLRAYSLDNTEDLFFQFVLRGTTIRRIENTMRKKKNILIIVFIILLLAPVVWFVGKKSYHSGFRTEPIDRHVEYADDVSYLNDYVGITILSYGDEIIFPRGLKYKTITDLKDDTIFPDEDCIYLIINDLSGNVEVEGVDFERIIRYADQHQNFNFYYIGDKKLNLIKASFTENVDLHGDLDFGYVMFEGDRIRTTGVWSTDYGRTLDTETKERLGFQLVDQMIHDLRTYK